MNTHVIDVAMGKAPADLIVKNGRLINVITKEIVETDIAVADGVIAAVGFLNEGMIGENTIIIDANGKYMAPGFIDAHIHFESSMLTYTEFAKMTVAHGTTAVASDCMEIAIVAGKEGIEEIMREAESLPVKLLYPVPAFMTNEGNLQTIGAALYPEMVEELLKKPKSVGLAEVLYPPILNKSPDSAHMLDLAEKYGRKTAEGHAPALYGEMLNAYASAGIRSDHESTNKEEAIEKLRRGLRVLIREGCAASDLDSVIKIITEDHVDTRHCALISDDIDMLHIYEKGHQDYKVRRAVEAGMDPVEALQLVTINPAESLKVDDKYGIIAPGRCADIVFITDLEKCTVDSVIANGELVVSENKLMYDFKAPQYSGNLLNTIKLPRKIEADDLVIHKAGAKTAKVRVIGANATTLLKDALEETVPFENGVLKAVTEKDVLHIACVERYGKKGGIGKAFVKGFGLKTGAIATSVGHDHHNITVIGSVPEDMAAAVTRISELKGGIVIAENGKIVYELALPICGLLSDKDGAEGALLLKKMQEDLHRRGCTMQSPFMTLAFLTLIYIPTYGITDQGLIDVMQMKPVDPVISTN